MATTGGCLYFSLSTLGVRTLLNIRGRSPSDAIRFAGELLATRYASMAGCIILWYDWMITLGDEVLHIWPAKRSSTKIIYLVSRYLNLIVQVAVIGHMIGLTPTASHRRCKFYILGYGTVVFFSLASIHIVILVRAWAVWIKVRWITITLAGAYATYTLACIAILAHAGITSTSPLVFSYQGSCMIIIAPSLWYIWIAGLALEYLTFVLTLINLNLHFSRMHPSLRRYSTLPRYLCRGALMCIICLTLAYVFNIVLWANYATRPMNMLATTFTYCIVNVAGQRFVLDLRRQVSSRPEPTHYEMEQMPTFALPQVRTEVDEGLSARSTAAPRIAGCYP